MSQLRVLLHALVPLFLATALWPPPLDAQEVRQKAGDERRERRERRRVDDSNTGYIDNAIVGSQIRVRLDAAFDGDRPDRAEFIYGKCDCYTTVAAQDSASPGPTEDLDYQELQLAVEHAFNTRFSLFVELPMRSIDLTFPTAFDRSPLDESGLGDIRAGLKYALIATKERYLTLQLRGYFPTGDAAKALGTDHSSIEPALLLFNQVSDKLAFESELRLWYPLSGSSDPVSRAGTSELNAIVGRTEPPAGTDLSVRNDGYAGEVLRFGVGMSYQVDGPRFSFTPVVELVGWFVRSGFATPNRAPFIEEAHGDRIVNVKLGTRIRTHDRGSVYVGAGFALTDDVWYESIFRLEYRHAL